MQYAIYSSIYNLPEQIGVDTPISDFNKYLIIQTFIELMDDSIINKLSSQNTIEKKRTEFLDSRLEQFKFDPSMEINQQGKIKYSNFGLLNKYYKPRIEFEASQIEMSFNEYVTYAGNGGLTNDVLTYFIDNVFGQYIKFSDNILESPENNYTLYKTNISLNDLLANIEKYKIKTASDNKKYRLVGIVYDCPDDVTHQITSLCYGDNCIKTPPTHTFHDDQLIKSKNIASPFNKSDLQWGCILVYEKLIILDNLYRNY